MEAPNVITREDLLDRWRDIEQLEEDFNERDDDPSALSSFLERNRQLKEQWFSSAYKFLMCQLSDVHVWCLYWDIMGPLLETFFNFFKFEDDDCPLKVLWRRICRDLRKCTECVSRHHQAQEMYKAEYESSFVSPLLDVFQRLDEERVYQHLKELNARLKPGYYDPIRDNPEVVSLMFEVLTFPALLEDEYVVNEFEHFIEAVDGAHELTLAKQQHFPGVYALLFFKSRKTRLIGHRLAGNMGRLRTAADLEPLQPLLKRCIEFMASDEEQSSAESPRPRVKMERMTVWLGLKSLLAFVEPQALEEGILEPYPVFLNFVLDHISDDSPEFSHAVNCMKLLFEILGCKLWLRTNLPPSVMRDSLLSQCFHTRNEKTHKEIFDLFHPLLQSLEALHDGEFEKQRRHLLYFLMHQVTRSSNFSMLMRKKACQIAFIIIHRGYKMNPPSPPTECAHMWGPSLVSYLKDSTLHSSLRQPAVDLIQTVIVSDAAALLSSLFHCQSPTVGGNIVIDLTEEMDDTTSCIVVDEEKRACSWKEFTLQSNIVCQEYGEWMCVPMLWLDVLVEIEPSTLSLSFSKAVLWALSHVSMVEPENSSEFSLPVKAWLSFSSSGKEVSGSFGWKSPTGSNDGGDGVPSKNSVKVSSMCISLIRTFRRLAAHSVVQMEQGEFRKHLTWEPQMGECLILLLSDPNDNVRQVGRRILELVSDTRGLSPGIQFLCSSGSSLTAILSGLKHALKLVQLDSVLANFQCLHHFFFVLLKIFKEGYTPTNHIPGSSSDALNPKFASQGGFLRQPTFENIDVPEVKQLTRVEKKLWETFKFELAEVAWPSLKKCLCEGKTFSDYKISQMTCVRILEVLPIVFEELSSSPDGSSGESCKRLQNLSDFSWLHNLIEWGKSSLDAVVRYWKQCLTSLLSLLKNSSNEKSATIIANVEKMILSGDIQMDSLMEQVSCLSVSIEIKDSAIAECYSKSKPSLEVVDLTKTSALDVDSFVHDDADVKNLDSVAHADAGGKNLDPLPSTRDKNKDSVILLSDEEVEPSTSTPDVRDYERPSKVSVLAHADKSIKHLSVEKETSECKASKTTPDSVESNVASDSGALSSVPRSSVTMKQAATSSLVKRKDKRIGEKEIKSKSVQNENKVSSDKEIAKSSSEVDKAKISLPASKRTVAQSNDKVLRDLVLNTEDPLEIALKSAVRNHSSLTKQLSSVPRRRVVQLAGPVDNRSANLRKLEAAARRFKPPKLDDWFRPILEMDYFAAVGLNSPQEEENKSPCDLTEVPISFESPKQYVDIFRPLVLEEFKAQLQSSFQELSSLEDMSCGSLCVVSVERVDDFHLVHCVYDDQEPSNSCMENDLVLLTKQPVGKSPHHVHVIGKVERRERDNKRRKNMLLIRFYLQNEYSRLNRARKLLTDRSKWFVSRIMSITSQLRECQALSSIDVIPAISVILKPSSHSPASVEHKKTDLGKLPQPMQQVLTSQFNESQLQAISTVIGVSNHGDDFELSLVQGPPGTGKTRTIVAIISAFLAVSPRSNAMDKQSTSNMRANSQLNSRACVSESTAIARAWRDAALARQLNNDMERDKKTWNSSVRKRVLVCAQSNAAVDELVARLAGEGLYGGDGNMYKPYLVRVGHPKTIHSNSLPFFIDTLVENRLAEEKVTAAGNESGGESSATLRDNLEKIVDRIRYYESKRANVKDGDSDKKCAMEDKQLQDDNGKEISNAELEARLRILYQQKKEIFSRLNTLQSQEKKIQEETRALKTKLRRSILREAEIVITTLSGCGGDLYLACLESTSHCKGSNIERNLFDAVVIDEAAQALEPATLIPLQLLKSCGTKCIMVGDPKQLPATVLSNVASRYMYECSMFERLQRAGHPVVLLTRQYRMHPEISYFPSSHFYDGKLLNGVQMSSKSTPFHVTKGLGAYVFYDIVDGKEGQSSGSSLYNEGEAEAAVEIVKFLQKRYPSEFAGGRIGIITPYKSQISLLRSKFTGAFGSSISSEMEFNTVDGFQGREVDILILSTVRSSDKSTVMPGKKSGGIGFVADVRRMNVALTRARLSLWILGNVNTLQRNKDWDALIRDARERDLIISVKRPYKSMFDKILNAHHDNSKSKGFRRANNEKSGRSHHVKQTPNHTMSMKRKDKNVNSSGSANEIKDASKEPVASEPLPGSKRKMDNTETCNDLSERQKTLEDSCKSAKKLKKKGGYQPKQESGGTSSGPEKQSQNPKGHENKSDLVSNIDSKIQGKGTDDTRRASIEVEKPKDLLSKRKQQREAVDALLSSALLPSKKSGTSKPVAQRRHPSPSRNMGSCVRSTKLQKDSKVEKEGAHKKEKFPGRKS